LKLKLILFNSKDIIKSDSDDKNLLFTSQGLRNVTCNTLHRKNNKISNTAEKLNFFKSQKHGTFENSSIQVKTGLKRKLENSNSINEFSKVPKKVMFKENDFNDENIQFIEISENEIGKNNEHVDCKAEDDLRTIVNFTLNQNDSEKNDIFQNDILDSNDQTSNNLTSSLPVLEHYENVTCDSDTEKVFELRMQNLIKQLVLSIPEICTICSQSFETYLDVLKHKIETHQNFNEDHCFCPICQKKYFSNYNLIQHLNEHKDIYSFVCILCFGSFYTEDTLRYKHKIKLNAIIYKTYSN
jgi:hypothetical protein